MMYRVPIKTIFKRAGIGAGAGYKAIRNFEKKISEFDRGFGGIPGDIYRASPLSLTYQQTVVPTKQLLKVSEKVFGSLGQPKTDKMKVATGLIEGAMTISGGTNDFIDRSLNSQTFNNLFRSPYVQSYLTS
jgi:hypothetical protein